MALPTGLLIQVPATDATAAAPPASSNMTAVAWHGVESANSHRKSHSGSPQDCTLVRILSASATLYVQMRLFNLIILHNVVVM